MIKPLLSKIFARHNNNSKHSKASYPPRHFFQRAFAISQLFRRSVTFPRTAIYLCTRTRPSAKRRTSTSTRHRHSCSEKSPDKLPYMHPAKLLFPLVRSRYRFYGKNDVTLRACTPLSLSLAVILHSKKLSRTRCTFAARGRKLKASPPTS